MSFWIFRFWDWACWLLLVESEGRRNASLVQCVDYGKRRGQLTRGNEFAHVRRRFLFLPFVLSSKSLGNLWGWEDLRTFPCRGASSDFLQKRLASEIRIPGFTQLNPTPKKLPFRNLRLSHVAFPRFPPEICPSSRDFFFSSFFSFSSPLLYLQLASVALTCQLSFRAINSLFSTRSTLRLCSLLTRSSNFFPTCKFQQIHTMAGITPRYVGISQKFIIKRS